MIPRAYIIQWSEKAPWPDENQVEQDLIISRFLVEIASNELLSKELAFRGGTCLHKLHLPEPLRYSEDLDYVRTNQEPMMGEIFSALRDIATRIGLREHGRKFRAAGSDMSTIWFDADAESGAGRIRIKIETNFGESTPVDKHIKLDYAVDSDWWAGQAQVRTFPIEEILGTKVRALCQRRKGRDLFDLWIGLQRPGVEDQVVVDTLNHYMREKVFSYPQLVTHLRNKIGDPEFEADLPTLVREVPDDYSPEDAVELIRRRIGLKLRNVPRDLAKA
jgi:predicted nucleotidyltransferase component of viral defense system